MGKHFDRLVRLANLVERKLAMYKFAEWQPEWLVTYKSWNGHIGMDKQGKMWFSYNGEVQGHQQEVWAKEAFDDCVDLWQEFVSIVNNPRFFSTEKSKDLELAINNFKAADNNGKGGRGWHQGDLEIFNTLLDLLMKDPYYFNTKGKSQNIPKIKNDFNRYWLTCFPNYYNPQKSEVQNTDNKAEKKNDEITNSAKEEKKGQEGTATTVSEQTVTAPKPSKYSSINPSIQKKLTWVLTQMAKNNEAQVPAGLLPLQADGAKGPQTNKAIKLYIDETDQAIYESDSNDMSKLESALDADVGKYVGKGAEAPDWYASVSLSQKY